MKQIYLFVVATLLSALGAHAGWDSDNDFYYLRTNDGLDKDDGKDGVTIVKSPFTFTMNSPQGWRDAGVVFLPANPGEVVTATLTACDLDGTTNYLLVYDGPIEAIGSGVSDGTNQSRYLPDGWTLKFTKDNIGASLISSAADGSLSFGFHSGSINGQNFTVTVQSVVPADMEYSSVEAAESLPGAYRGEKNHVLARYNVVTSGMTNPLTLNTLKINVTPTEAISNVRLMQGTAEVAALADGSLTAADITLKPGNNYFDVVADIAPDASGTIPAPAIATLKVGGADRDFSGATAAAHAVANEIRMTADATTFTISGPTTFYDDGGADANISANFEGTLTFKPSTAGSAVKIDFTSLDLFNTSSTGMNDLLKIYDGATPDEANLNTTMLKEPGIVKSGADDGSLTVTLKSTTGYPKSGWTASVSEFQPGPMTVSQIAAEAVDAESTVSMGQTAQMLIFDILTDNSQSPLSLSALSLTKGDNVSSTRLYALGRDKTAAGSETDINAPAAELREGHNYFRIDATVKDGTSNGADVTLTLNSVTVGTAEHAVGTSVTRKVKNTVRATEGTTEVSLSQPWEFEPEMNGSKYAGGTTDRIVVFKPATPGTRAQIDFDAFDVYYASSSYGTKATFEIYNGTGTDAANIAWKLDDASKANVCPPRIRSNAADGSLTVRFNPNYGYSSYTAAGWHATVKEFADHDMTVIGSSATQIKRDLPVGATDAPLITFTVETEGTTSPLTIKSFDLALIGADLLSKVRLYSGATESRADAVLFGEADPADNVTVSGSVTLSEGTSHWWVEVDVKDTAAPETAVDAAMKSLKDAAGNTTELNLNPEGSRTTKLILLLESGEHTVNISQNIHFYDDGGAEGKICSVLGSSATATYTFVPSDPDYSIELDAKTFSIGNGRIYLYSGRTADDAAKLGKTTGYGTTSGPVNVISEAADGSVTMTIKCPTGKTLDGFDIEIKLHEKQPFTLNETTADAVTAKTVRGATGVVMSHIGLDIAGDKGDNLLNGMTLGAGENISRVALYYGGTATVFNPNVCTLMASADVDAAGDITLSTAEPIGLGGRGHYNLFIVADMAADAESGAKAAVKPAAIVYNGESKALEAETFEIELVAGLAAGEYSVGTETSDYKDLAEMTAALANGIEGPVTFTIAEGTYTTPLRLKAVAGTSAANTLTIKGINRQTTVIEPAYDYEDDAVSIEQTPYVALRDLTVNGGSSFKNAIGVRDRSHHLTLDNCTVTGSEVTASTGISLLRTITGTESGCTNDDITVTNNSFSGGYIAVYLAGSSYVDQARQQGALISGNNIVKASAKAIYPNDVDNVQICGNTAGEVFGKNSYIAIDVNRCHGVTLTGNRVVNDQTRASTGVYLRSGSSDIVMGNNEIIITDQHQYGYAMQVSNDCHDMLIAHNTLRSTGEGGYVYATTGNNPVSNVRLVNNIFEHKGSNLQYQKGTAAIYLAFADNAAGYTVENNAVSCDNENLLKLDSDFILSIDDFNEKFATASGNIQATGEFLSDLDSHLVAAGQLCRALPLHRDDLAHDRAGVRRNATTPTIGAYEYVDLEAVKPELAEGYPMPGEIGEYEFTVKTRWNVTGKLYGKALPAGAEAPSIDELLATTAADITQDVESSFKFTGLTDNSDYRAHFFVVSALNVEGDVITTEPIHTLRHIEPLEAEATGASITAGEEAVLTATVIGGDLPYSYVWKSQDGETVGNEASVSVSPANTQAYYMTVTSADGQSLTVKTHVDVLGDFVPATFDDNLIGTTPIMPQGDEDALYSGSLAFNGMSGTYGTITYWSGYCFSNETSTEFTGLDDQYRSAAGGGFDSANFGVAFPLAYTIDVTNNAEGEVIQGMYVTNAAYAYAAMADGIGVDSKFGPGDFFKLTVVGTDATGNENTIDYYLADLRSANEADHYILDKWEWLDLRSLGPVKSLGFRFDSSDTGQFGVNTPTYICLDNVGENVKRTEYQATVTEGEPLDIAPFFTVDNPDATHIYAIEPAEGVALDGSMLTMQQSGKVNAQMTSRGRTQYITLDITVEPQSGIAGIYDDVEDAVAIELYRLDGVRILNAAIADFDSRAMQPGIYLMRYLDSESRAIAVRKISIR